MLLALALVSPVSPSSPRPYLLLLAGPALDGGRAQWPPALFYRGLSFPTPPPPPPPPPLRSRPSFSLLSLPTFAHHSHSLRPPTRRLHADHPAIVLGLDTTSIEPRPLAHLSRHPPTPQAKEISRKAQHHSPSNAVHQFGILAEQAAITLALTQLTVPVVVSQPGAVPRPEAKHPLAPALYLQLPPAYTAGTLTRGGCATSRRPTATCHNHPVAGRQDAIITFVIPLGSVFRQLRPCFLGRSDEIDSPRSSSGLCDRQESPWSKFMLPFPADQVLLSG